MEAMLVPSYKTSFRLPPIDRKCAMQSRKRSPFILSVHTINNDLDSKSTIDHQSKTVYNDNWFHRLAINYVSQKLQAATGHKSIASGYDGLVEAARMVHRNFSPTQQRDVILQTLAVAAPRPITNLIRTLQPPSKRAREYFAFTTALFFTWMIGHCEVRESEVEGRKEKNVVYIPKCRFLGEANCVGMCTNLCKMPSQVFIKEAFGTPINMVPNFDDMSCEMIFGQEAPPQSLDPASKQPCYKQCKDTKRHQEKCTT